MTTALTERLLAGAASAVMTVLVVGSQLGLAWRYTSNSGDAVLASTGRGAAAPLAANGSAPARPGHTAPAAASEART